jgi:hypothetical protein
MATLTWYSSCRLCSTCRGLIAKDSVWSHTVKLYLSVDEPAKHSSASVEASYELSPSSSCQHRQDGHRQHLHNHQDSLQVARRLYAHVLLSLRLLLLSCGDGPAQQQQGCGSVSACLLQIGSASRSLLQLAAPVARASADP